MVSGCASVLDEDGALAMVPYTINDSGFIVVEARVNQQGPFSMALDSGATISSIFDPLRDELGLDAVPGRWAIVHGAVAKGEFDVLDVERISIGDEEWIHPRVVSLPGDSLVSAGIKGLLGVDFLKQYAVSFSATERVIRLYSPDRVEQGSYQGWATIPLRTETIGGTGAALYFFDVEIDGHEIAAAFDLGAGLNLMNWAGAKSLGAFTGRSRSKQELTGAFESMPIAARLTSDVIKTASVRWKDEEFSVADLDLFALFGRADRPTAILGVGLFTQRDFIIDLVRRRLLIRTSMDEIVAPESPTVQESN